MHSSPHLSRIAFARKSSASCAQPTLLHAARFDFAFPPAGNPVIQASLVPCRYHVGPPVGDSSDIRGVCLGSSVRTGFWSRAGGKGPIREILGSPSVLPRTPGSGFSVIRGAFLGSKIAVQASETIRGRPRPSPIRAIPRIWKGSAKNAHSQNAHTRAHVLTPPCTQRHTKRTRKIMCQNQPVVCSTRGAHETPLYGKESTHGTQATLIRRP